MKWFSQLNLLRILVLWAMASSDTLKGLINQSYKQNRHEDDINQPRAVQPWGSDGDKRRYFLVEGQDDTAFRVYRESNPAGTNRTWWSVAGSIEELKALADKLETKDGGPKARKLSQKILQAIPRFEAGDEVTNTARPHSVRANKEAETKAARVSSVAQRTIQAPRAWIFTIRRPYSR